MIHLPKEQSQLARYLIQQSRLGHHVLFEVAPLRTVLLDVLNEEERLFRAPPLTEEEAYSAELYLEKMMAMPTLEDQRDYLLGLDPPTLKQVIRTYFRIVESDRGLPLLH